jgi:HEAT repeat protein
MEPRERESIHHDLASSDAEVRRLAVERALLLPEVEALPCLLDRLGDADWRVRKAAVERIATLPDEVGVTEALVASLADGDNTGRRNSAVEALMRRGAESVPGLMRASSSGDADVRKLVVDALGGIGDPRAMDRLLEMLGDPDPNVRGAVADALGASGSQAAAGPLLRVARDSDEHVLVRLSALCALRTLRAELRVMDLEPALAHPLLCAVSFELLGHSDDPTACSVLVKGLVSSSRSSREAAMQALLGVLGRAVPDEAESVAEAIREAMAGAPETLRDAALRLGEADLPTRLVLIQILGLAGGEESVVPILCAGTDEELADLALGTLEKMGELAEAAMDAAFPRLEPAARALACRSLGRTRGPRALPRLRSGLADPEVEVRIASAEALGACGAEETLSALASRLSAAAREVGRDAEDELRAIGSALGRLEAGGDRGVRTVRLLAPRLERAEVAERTEIARILGSLGEPLGCEAVTLLVSDPAPSVRRAAVESLARLAPTSESLRLALADDSPLVRIAAAGCLGGFETTEVLEDLGCLTRDDDERVRASAARAIACLAASDLPPEEHARLVELLSAAVSDAGSVAIAAVEGLASLGGAEAARATLPALGREDPEIVQSAVRCLGTHGDSDALQYLVPLVAHSEWLVRAEAIEVLARRRAIRAVPAILRHLEAEDDEFVREVILRALKRLED